MTAIDSNTYAIKLADYESSVKATDRLPPDDLRPVLMGLFGEVGSIMAPAKKLHREKEVFSGYMSAVEEEFGDALWYFAALVRRTGHNLPEVFSAAVDGGAYAIGVSAGNVLTEPTIQASVNSASQQLDDALIALGGAAAALLSLTENPDGAPALLNRFVATYLEALQTSRVNFAAVVSRNISKARGRFLPSAPELLPTFDYECPEDEQLPMNFEIVIKPRASGLIHMQWNGVFLGDPLSDNILDKDGYRFHDVFHFAHAAILHWSPTFRALTKRKRKSNRVIDEAQDGGRAIVVEEGLTAWLFSQSKDLSLFSGKTGVSFDILKTIQQFVRGYEVQDCPLSQWEHAILRGYEVFRQVKDNKGGVVSCSRATRTITYSPL